MGLSESVLNRLKIKNSYIIELATNHIKFAYKKYIQGQEEIIKELAKKHDYEINEIELSLEDCSGEIYFELKEEWEDKIYELKTQIEKDYKLAEMEHDDDLIKIVYYKKPFRFESYDADKPEIELDEDTEQIIDVISVVFNELKGELS